MTIVRFDNAPVNALDLDLLEVIMPRCTASRAQSSSPVPVGPSRPVSTCVLWPTVEPTTPGASLKRCLRHSRDLRPPGAGGRGNQRACDRRRVRVAMCADVRLMSGGTIGLTELAVGVPFPVAALEICRDGMGITAARAALQAKTIDADTALARGWIDAVVPKDELLSQALAAARELGQYSPAAYAATKKQLHKPVRAAINAGTTTDENVRASWISEETRDRINGFLESLARGR